MSDAKPPEELGLETALEVLEAPLAELEARLLGVDDATAALRKPHLDALVQLAWALPAEPASAVGRQRLLGALQGDETVKVARPSLAGPAEARPASGPFGVLDPPVEAEKAGAGAGGARGATPRTGGTAPAGGAGPRRGPAPVVPFAAPPRSYRWALPLAAVFALAAFGIAFHDWRLGQQLDATRGRLATVDRDRQQLASRLQGAGPVPAGMEAKVRELESQLAMVSSSGSLVCALRPSPGAAARDAAGVLYVAGDHQHWYLRAQKLPPPGDGRAYRLWFMVGDKPVHAGDFAMAGDEAVMSSPTMPKGTSAAMITLEPAGQPGERPSGPAVLYGRDIKPLV